MTNSPFSSSSSLILLILISSQAVLLVITNETGNGQVSFGPSRKFWFQYDKGNGDAMSLRAVNAANNQLVELT